MVGELITLPLRVGVRATQLWLRATEETLAVAADAAGRLIDSVVPRDKARGSSGGATPSGTSVDRREPAYEAGPPAPPAAPEAAPPATSDSPEWEERAPEPVHVSEAPELVESVAEPGAEDGAGASIHVEAPWEGYEQMKAEDVIDRLAGATAAELAAIQLYESQRKRRVTVLEGVERQLRISSGSGSHR